MSVILPSNKKALVRAVKAAADASASIRNESRSVRWAHTYLYLQGCRKFKNINYKIGNIEGVWETDKGQLKMELNTVNQQIDTEIGRFDAIDLSPASRQLPGTGIDALRKASMGQVVFDHILGRESLAETNSVVFRNMILYGMCGVISKVSRLADGATHVYGVDVAPPWEIGSVPAQPNSLSDVGAVVRDRMVSLDWLREAGKGQQTVDGEPVFKIPADGAKLGIRMVKYGDSPTDNNSPADRLAGGGIHANFDEGDDSGKDDDSMPYVRLIEMWVRRREDDSLQRKIAIVGDVLVADQSFGTEAWYEDNPDTPRPPQFPVGICQYSATGSGIYSRGFAEMLIPLSSQIEAMLQSVTKSIHEYDQFGIILFPSTLGVTKRDFKISSKPKIGTYEPDPAVPGARPFQMRPVNAGTLPQSVLSLMLSLADRQSSQSPILRGDAPGRVDSNSALNTLFQASNIPLAGPARSLATAYRKVYSALMYEAKRRWSSNDKLRMTTIDDSVAGLVLDPKTLSVRADSSGVPWPHEVEIGVKSTEAEDKAQKQQLAMQLSESKKKMWIFNYKNELGLPDLEPRIKESVRKAQLINVLLYGDGKTPGDPKMDEDADDLEVLLVIVEDFMARIEFSLSENEVKEAFKHYQSELKSRIGGQVPEQAPDFLQAAIQAQQVVAQQQQAAAQGGPV